MRSPQQPGRFLPHALEHAGRGFKVFPCHQVQPDGACSCGKGKKCRTVGKHPRFNAEDLPNGCLSATDDEEQIRTWARRWPNANIGIAAGAPSGVWILDVDPRHGGDRTLAELEARHGPLPPTVRAKTGGGGYHYAFAPDAGAAVPNEVGFAPGLDTRSTGGLIVAPGSLHASGALYEWDPEFHPDRTPIARAPEWLVNLIAAAPARVRQAGGGAPIDEKIPHGAQHNSLVRFAGAMRRKGAGVDEIDAALQVMNRNRCEVPGEPEDIRTIAESICQYRPAEALVYVARETGEVAPLPSEAEAPPPRRSLAALIVPDEPPAPAANGHGPPPGEEPEGDVATAFEAPAVTRDQRLHLTDLGNARRLVERHGENLRYCSLFGRWLVWDGARWAMDEDGRIVERAKETALSIHAEALSFGGSTERDKIRDAVLAWARKTEGRDRISAMVNLAQSDPMVTTRPEDFDRDPWLLNTENATIDLQTGDPRERRRSDLATRLAGVRYDAKARCPRFDQFLLRVMDGNDALIAYLRRVVGFCLTGIPPDREMFFLYGRGRNGKSTLMELLHELLGEYSRKVAAETLLAKPNTQGDGIPNDLARLCGARLVTSAELPENRRLNEARIKDLTGRDRITARLLRQEFFEFEPCFKLFMYGNHKPVVRGSDDGIWDRLKLIPFAVRISDDEVDPHLPGRLRAELPGVLNWALTGCLEWQNGGLRHPDEVKAATAAYRGEMDRLQDFRGDCCQEGDPTALQSKPRDLYDAYCGWSGESGETPISETAFALELRQRGFDRKRSGTSGRRWLGIALSETGERLMNAYRSRQSESPSTGGLFDEPGECRVSGW